MSNKSDYGPEWTSSQICSFLEICYFYGVSEAALCGPVEILYETEFLDRGLWDIGNLPTTELVSLIRYGGELSNLPGESIDISFHVATRWLQFYSLLELGILSGTIPSELPASFKSVAIQELNRHDMGAYAEAGFPLAEMFRHRLEGRSDITFQSDIAVAHHSTTIAFNYFLSFENTIRSNAGLTRLLWLGRFSSVTSDLKAIIVDSVQVRNLPDVLYDPFNPYRFLPGDAHEFLEFCMGLSSLLSHAGLLYPDLAAAIRQYYNQLVQPFVEKENGPLRLLVLGYKSALTKWSREELFNSEEDREIALKIIEYNRVMKRGFLSQSPLWTSGEGQNTLFPFEAWTF